MQSPLEAPAKSLYGQSGLHSSCPNRSTHQKSLGSELLSRRKGDTQSSLIEEFSKLVGFKQGNSTWGLCSLQSFCRLCFCELWVVSIPMRNSTDSKCNGKRKQYFKDIGDSETLPWFSSLLVMLFIPPLLAGDMNLIIPATQPPNEKQQLPSRSKSAWNQRADSGFSETPFNVVTLWTGLPIQTKLGWHIWPSWAALCLCSTHPALQRPQITAVVGGKPEVFNKCYYFISFC